jgi:hypothetical protein
MLEIFTSVAFVGSTIICALGMYIWHLSNARSEYVHVADNNILELPRVHVQRAKASKVRTQGSHTPMARSILVPGTRSLRTQGSCTDATGRTYQVHRDGTVQFTHM